MVMAAQTGAEQLEAHLTSSPTTGHRAPMAWHDSVRSRRGDLTMLVRSDLALMSLNTSDSR